MSKPSLYDNAVHAGGGEQDPEPGTALTASVEAIDNDRAGLMLDSGVVR